MPKPSTGFYETSLRNDRTYAPSAYKKSKIQNKRLYVERSGFPMSLMVSVAKDVAAAPQSPQLGGARPTLGAQISLKLLFGYVTIFCSADLFTTDLNCRKKLACDIISKCYLILSRRILNIRLT